MPAGIDLPPPPPRPETPVVEIHAVEESVEVDGVLDEAGWAAAPALEPFHRYLPVEGGPISGTSSGKLLATPRALCFAIVVTDEAGATRAHVTARESEALFSDDLWAIRIDPYLDHRNIVELGTNPLGVQFDARIQGNGNEDMSWDAAWDSRGRLTADGWVVEACVPWASLRFPRGDSQRWGVSLGRHVARNNELQIWPEVRDLWGPFNQQMGVVSGLEVPKRRTRLELWPALVVRYGAAREDGAAALLTPAPKPWELFDPGLGVRWLATRNLVVDAAVNPDFSQVESDPFQLDANLRYALFLPERRPFFQEGAEHMPPGGEYGMFYSRLVSDPLFGLKLSGKEGRVGIGFLEAFDLAPTPSFLRDDVERRETGWGVTGQSSCPTPGFCAEDTVGKGSLNHVARLRFDVGTQSTLGVAYVEKDLLELGTTPLNALLGLPRTEGDAGSGGRPSRVTAVNRVLGLDGNFRFARNWWISAAATGSYTSTEKARMGGGGWNVEGGRSGRHFEFGGGFFGATPGQRSELGYYPHADRIGGWAFTSARAEPERPGLVWLEPELSGWWAHTLAGKLAGSGVELGVALGGALGSRFSWDYEWESERFAGENFSLHGGDFGARISLAKWITVQGGVEWGDGIYYDPGDPFLGSKVETELELLLRPAARLAITPGVGSETFWSRERVGEGAEAIAAGDKVYEQAVVRLKEELAFSPHASLRAIQEWDSYDRMLRNSLLLTVLRWPGTGLYLGGSLGLGYPGKTLQINDFQVFFKASYVLRI
jgi:hypothetical protein